MSKTHGKWNTRVYRIYRCMLRRCNSPTDVSYESYGGRGIKICDYWLESFENFYSDMGDLPSDSHSLDQINVNGNYEKSNCRWTTNRIQAFNKKTRIDNKSGCRGVSWHKHKQKWRAVSSNNGKQVHLGYFDSLELASQAHINYLQSQGV